jgi:hypothetical protein
LLKAFTAKTPRAPRKKIKTNHRIAHDSCSALLVLTAPDFVLVLAVLGALGVLAVKKVIPPPP